MHCTQLLTSTNQAGALRNTHIYLFLFVMHFNIKFPAPSPHLHLLGHHERTLQLLVKASERLRVARKSPQRRAGLWCARGPQPLPPGLQGKPQSPAARCIQEQGTEVKAQKWEAHTLGQEIRPMEPSPRCDKNVDAGLQLLVGPHAPLWGLSTCPLWCPAPPRLDPPQPCSSTTSRAC